MKKSIPWGSNFHGVHCDVRFVRPDGEGPYIAIVQTDSFTLDFWNTASEGKLRSWLQKLWDRYVYYHVNHREKVDKSSIVRNFLLTLDYIIVDFDS